MKVSDFIIEFLFKKGVKDIFGYPGGCINHLIDSAFKSTRNSQIGVSAHLAYNEQGAAFAACGYAQNSNKLGVAYSTSGPGATNLMTGIASAYFDYIPTLFITGNVDSNAEKGDIKIRQRGFQETDIVACISPITKWAYHISKVEEVKSCLEKAYYIAFDGAPGPVLLDIPNDIQRAEMDVDISTSYSSSVLKQYCAEDIQIIINELKVAKRPIILAGNGIKQNKLSSHIIDLANKINSPVITSMSAFDVIPYQHELNFGFIGTNGHRFSNFISEKADLILALGNRMSIRPLGVKREIFAPKAKIIRIDSDLQQLKYHIRDDEICIIADLKAILPELITKVEKMQHNDWISVCKTIKKRLCNMDIEYPHNVMIKLSDIIPSDYNISSDIGQNLSWLAQAYRVKQGQHVCMSTGNGPMGYSIPAGIGSFLASRRPVVSFCGDGGLMMNLQELQFIKREHIPNKIVCFNNHALGMIRAWQERFLDSYSQTTLESGYSVVNLEQIAKTFDLKYTLITELSQLRDFSFENNKAELIEVVIPTEIATNPNGDMHDQNPKIDRNLFEEIMQL